MRIYPGDPVYRINKKKLYLIKFYLVISSKISINDNFCTKKKEKKKRKYNW